MRSGRWTSAHNVYRRAGKRGVAVDRSYENRPAGPGVSARAVPVKLHRPFTISERIAMTDTTRGCECNAGVTPLLMALELGKRQWLVGFTTGPGIALRQRRLRAANWDLCATKSPRPSTASACRPMRPSRAVMKRGVMDSGSTGISRRSACAIASSTRRVLM